MKIFADFISISQFFLGQGRNIQPLPCQDKKGSRGVCMFAWNCAESGGTHLGTCVDRFYFGSCCELPVVIKPEDLDQMNSETDIQTDPSESIAAPGAKYLVFSPLVPSKREKNILVLLSLYIF